MVLGRTAHSADEHAGDSDLEVRMLAYWSWMFGRLRVSPRKDDESGASLVEYAFLVALIALVCIVAVSLLGSNASGKFSQVGSALQ
jgi:Flp pilus assembly pilin Flp